MHGDGCFIGGSPGSVRHAVAIDADHLARVDLALERGADQVERAGLARHDVAAVEPAEGERAEAHGSRAAYSASPTVSITAERAGHPGQRVENLLLERLLPRARDQVHDDLGVDRGLEERALAAPARRAARWRS
jgi:hypothetical protein